MKIKVTVDPGENEGHLEYIVAEVDKDDLLQTIHVINKKGIHDSTNSIWYPPHQVRKVEYDSPTP